MELNKLNNFMEVQFGDNSFVGQSIHACMHASTHPPFTALQSVVPPADSGDKST